jgi:hypothetical protein
VFGGMITSTFLAIFLVPVFYVIVQSASERWAARRSAAIAPGRAEPRFAREP